MSIYNSICEKRFHIFAGVFSVFFIFIFLNLPPLQRYPNWDHVWGGGLTASNLVELKLALTNLALPALSPYKGFGWNQWGDTTEPSNPLSIVDLFVLLIPLELALLIRTCIYASIGWLGAYFVLKDCPPYTPNLQLLGAYLFVFPPFILAVTLHLSMTFQFYLIPTLFLLIKKYFQTGTDKSLLILYLYFVFCYASGDVYGLITFFGCAFAFATICYFFSPKDILICKKYVNVFKTSVLASMFYALPLFWNIKTNTTNLQEIVSKFGVPSIVSGVNLQSFLNILQTKGGAEIILNPHDANVLFFYMPFSFFVIAIVLAIGLFKKISPDRIDKTTRLWINGLLCSFVVLIIGTILYYSVPFIYNKATGLFRLHLSWIFFAMPLLIILLSKSFFFSHVKYSAKVSISLTIFCISIIWDFLLLCAQNNNVGFIFKNIYHWKRYNAEPQNLLIKSILNYDPYYCLFLINISFLFLYFMCILFDNIYKKENNKAYAFFPLVFIIAFSFISLNVHSAARYFGDSWAFQAKNNIMYNNFNKIKIWLNKFIDSSEKRNYRLIFCGKNIYKDYEGRNINAVYPTELLAMDKFKVFGTYRNTINPYEALYYYRLTGKWSNGNLFPPKTENIVKNKNLLRLIGCKYVVALDSEIYDESFKKISDLSLQGSGFFPDLDDSCIVTLYSLDAPQSIAIQDNSTGDKNIKNVFISSENYDKIIINVEDYHSDNFILKYNYSPFWKASSDSSRISLSKNEDGFLSIKAYKYLKYLYLVYVPWDVYLGLLITFCGLAPIFIRYKINN